VGNTSTLTRQLSIAPPAPGATPLPSPSDTTPPVLHGAKLRPPLLPTGVGAILGVRSSEPARLAATVQHQRRHGGWRTVGTKQWVVAQGTNKLRFYGRTAEQRLHIGVYRAKIVGTDAAGNASVPATIRFLIDRG
jgi:hypothetical protein